MRCSKIYTACPEQVQKMVIVTKHEARINMWISAWSQLRQQKSNLASMLSLPDKQSNGADASFIEIRSQKMSTIYQK